MSIHLGFLSLHPSFISTPTWFHLPHHLSLIVVPSNKYQAVLLRFSSPLPPGSICFFVPYLFPPFTYQPLSTFNPPLPWFWSTCQPSHPLIWVLLLPTSPCRTPPSHFYLLFIFSLHSQACCKVPIWNVSYPFASIDAVLPAHIFQQFFFFATVSYCTDHADFWELRECLSLQSNFYVSICLKELYNFDRVQTDAKLEEAAEERQMLNSLQKVEKHKACSLSLVTCIDVFQILNII